MDMMGGPINNRPSRRERDRDSPSQNPTSTEAGLYDFRCDTGTLLLGYLFRLELFILLRSGTLDDSARAVLESSLLLSIPAVGIILPQFLWVADLISGARITMMTSYMFDSNSPLFGRGLSAFHGWLPFLLIWGVWRLGYDRRAFVIWPSLSTAVLLICYFFAPVPPAPASNPNLAVNINFVHGLGYEKPQTLLHPWLWLTALIVGYPIMFYLPCHLALRTLFLRPLDAGTEAGAETALQVA